MNRKQEIIDGLIAARQRILDAISDLPPDKQDHVFLGTWSIKDILAHLIGWDGTNIDAVTDIRAGRSPRVFQQWDPDWVKYNAELVRKYKRDNFSKLLDSIHQSHAALIEFVRMLPAEEIDKDFGIRSPGGTNITVERFLQFEIEDEGQHYQQIQEWLS